MVHRATITRRWSIFLLSTDIPTTLWCGRCQWLSRLIKHIFSLDIAHLVCHHSEENGSDGMGGLREGRSETEEGGSGRFVHLTIPLSRTFEYLINCVPRLNSVEMFTKCLFYTQLFRLNAKSLVRNWTHNKSLLSCATTHEKIVTHITVYPTSETVIHFHQFSHSLIFLSP